MNITCPTLDGGNDSQTTPGMKAPMPQGRRMWQFALAGFALLLSLFLVLDTNYARQGVSRIVHLVARSQVKDWAAHVVSKHAGILRYFGKRPLPDEVVADMRRDAKAYGIEAFRLHTVLEPLGRVRIYASDTFETPQGKLATAIMTGAMAEERSTGLVKVRVPLRTADGHRLGEISAVVDQRVLYRQLSQALEHLSKTAIAALVIVLLLALFLFRRVRDDAVQHIHQIREYDELTGLPNHVAFEQYLGRLLTAEDVREQHFACFVFGVDNLGQITCAEGHAATGHLLRTLAGRFARLMHERGSFLFRLERDDFAAVLPLRSANREEALHAARGLLAEAQRPVYWRGKSLMVAISIGITFHPDPAQSPSEVVRQAALMRQAARDAGGNDLRVYDAEMDRAYHEQAHLERLLRKAARNCVRYFTLHYQPIVHLEDETLYGFEVLLRLDDDDGNPVSPAQFIPLAEQLNLMDAIGAFVLAEACATAAKWPGHLHVSVNLSPLQFRSGKLAANVWKALETSGLDPRRLELEVTESIMMDDWETVHEQLKAVRRRGVRIVLDDFGTGYSSMSYLWKFRFDKLKIDRSFTQAIATCQEARSILRSLAIMARSLELPVVVEGVETAEQAAFLRKFRCQYGQGYYFGKPMPAEEVAAAIVRDWQRRRKAPSRTRREADHRWRRKAAP